MHIGNILRERLKAEGKSVVWLARELGCHRTNVYNLFDKYSLDTMLLERLSIIRRSRQTLWGSCADANPKTCCQTIHNCPKSSTFALCIRMTI